MKLFKQILLGAAMILAVTPAVQASSHSTIPVVGKGIPLVPTKGTTSFYQTITYQNDSRSVLFIKPATQSSTPAPVIIMLHYHGGTAELQANLSHAGNLAAQMGYWVILPPAVAGYWNADPADTAPTADDVGYLTNLIHTVTAQYPVDATRVSMTGLSDGGFMTTRMACEQPDLIAAGVAVAAQMRDSLQAVCRPSRPVPMVFVLGTKDPLVPYNGTYQFTGAAKSFGTWTGFNACNTSDTTTTNLPVLVNDGTSVTLQHNAACTSLGEADLYTVANGGHAWPGGQPNLAPFGKASQNLDTTTMIGTFFQQWTTKSTT